MKNDMSFMQGMKKSTDIGLVEFVLFKDHVNNNALT